MISSKTSWRQQLPDFLQFLTNELRYRVRPFDKILEFPIYVVDFSAWKLRFSERTPIIWVSENDVAAFSPRELAQSLAEVGRTGNLTERNPIVLIEGTGERLREQFETSFLPIMVLDSEDQRAVRTSRRPTGEMLDRLSMQVDIVSLAPYETSKPVTGSRFFGRELEIRRILQSDSDIALTGVRRIGKTSLMQEAARQKRESLMKEADVQNVDKRVIFMDCSAIESPAHFIQEVVRKLRLKELYRLTSKKYPIYFPDFLERMSRRYGRPLTFFLDEFDRVLEWHHQDKMLLNALRTASKAGSCRFIFGGFREVMRAATDQTSPLYNFAQLVKLGEFRRDQTASMVIEPLEKLRVRFERRNEVVGVIYNETAGHPHLIQSYCRILVEQLDEQGTRIISPESLFGVYNNDIFRAFVLNTFMDNTRHLEKAVVLAILEAHGAEESFGRDVIDEALRRRGIEFLFSDIDMACRNLEIAGILTLHGRQYRFTSPIFPRMLDEHYNVDFLFRKTLEEAGW